MRLIAPIIALEGRRADEKQFAKAEAILEAADIGEPPGAASPLA
jgi:hypothetical protein